MTHEILKKLTDIIPDERISVHPDELNVVSKDESTLDPVVPIAVVWPLSTDEISKLVCACVETKTPITTRGAGSALEGSTIPLENGIVLDLSRMVEIQALWPQDLQVRVQPGIIYDNLNLHLKDEGLFFPPSPGGSGDIATIGGMVATNASGIYSVKYGGTKDYILELEAVTGTGEIIHLGNRAIKRSSGYNLVDLICGSEGTLAIVTSITLRLAGLPEAREQSAYIFEDNVRAATAVSEMCRYGLDLAAVEFLDLELVKALNKLKNYGLKEKPCLFLEFHGPKTSIEANRELADEICIEAGASPLELSSGQRPWEIRHFATDAVKHHLPGYSIVRNDVAFPISQLPQMVKYCHELGQENNLQTFTFGHVGMGLLHALILARKEDHNEWSRALKMSDAIIRRTLELDGTISGEHGIGIGHKNLFELEHGSSVDYMRRIKTQFDPSGILNPGKIFDI